MKFKKKNNNFQIIDLITIKQLLKNKNTNNYYNNPVVISNRNNKSESIEVKSSDNQNIKI